MLFRRTRQFIATLSVFALVVLFIDSNVSALQSSNYRLDETAIGNNTLLNSTSTNFRVDSAVGDLSVGNSASNNFQVEAGTQTSNDPVLAFAVLDSDATFGDFSATAPTTTTTTFSVRNYTSYGYVVQITGTPPTNGSYVIEPLTTGGTSTPGVEQFGINLVANTLPVSVGSNPNNGNFGFGEAALNYDVPNQYRYDNGDIIARAPKSSGETIYTISYLVNVAALTPGGRYESNQTIIVTGTY